MHDCVFCKIAKGDLPSWKIYEDDTTLAFFDVNPVNEYHTLVIPKNHYVDIFDIPNDELIGVAQAIKHITSLLKEKVGIKNLQIVSSSGEEAQQDVFHIHFHIVPRRKGDNQDIRWSPKPELTEKFDELLAQLV
jgi:histidine triad (HIT) family protein